MSNIIAFSGTHGTGKTISVYKKANNLKMSNHIWIFSEQIATELMMSKVYDIVVSDGTIIDTIAYTMIFGYKGLANAMLRIADEHIHIYKEIYFKSLEKNDYLEDDSMRHSDKDLRMQVEDQMLELYHFMSDNFEGKIYY